ncbi:hypothetical protein ACFV0D_24295, partial [Streptomyces sp. NPDC059556]
MLLEVRDLHVEFHTRDGVAKAVNGVDYSVDAGENRARRRASGSRPHAHPPPRVCHAPKPP